MRTLLRKTPGDAHRGQQVFGRVCGQCHKLYGQGQEVGPDITLNGRNSFEQLLSNVFDPSLVIGAAYQARTIVTADGRVLTGLVAEESDEHVILKLQGGKSETIARGDIEQMKTSQLSLMPEDVEKQLTSGELADLFALLTLDKPPDDPSAKKLPGSSPVVPRETADPAKFGELAGEVAPGFVVVKAGRPPLAIVAEHAGREGVLRTRAGSPSEPVILRGKFSLPGDKQTRLVLAVSHDTDKPWTLTVNASGKRLHQELVGAGRGAGLGDDLAGPERPGRPRSNDRAGSIEWRRPSPSLLGSNRDRFQLKRLKESSGLTRQFRHAGGATAGLSRSASSRMFATQPPVAPVARP